MSNNRKWVTTPALNKAQLVSLVGDIDKAVEDGRVHSWSDVARVYMDEPLVRVLPDRAEGSNPFTKPIFEVSGYIRTVSAHNIVPDEDGRDVHGFIALPERVSRTKVLLEPSEADLARLVLLGLYDADFDARLLAMSEQHGYQGVELHIPMNIYSYEGPNGLLVYTEPEPEGSYTIALSSIDGTRGFEPYFIPFDNVEPVFDGVEGFVGVSRTKAYPEPGFLDLYEDLYFEEIVETREPSVIERVSETMENIEALIGQSVVSFKERFAEISASVVDSYEDSDDFEYEDDYEIEEEVDMDPEVETEEVVVETKEPEVVSEVSKEATTLLENVGAPLVAKSDPKEEKRFNEFESRFQKMRKPEFMQDEAEDNGPEL